MEERAPSWEETGNPTIFFQKSKQIFAARKKARRTTWKRPFMNASKETNGFVTVIKVPFSRCVKSQALPHTNKQAKTSEEGGSLVSWGIRCRSEVNI